MRWGRYLFFTLWEMEGPARVGVFREFQTIAEGYAPGRDPFKVNCTIDKSLNSTLDSCQLNVMNHPFAELWYEEGPDIRKEFLEKEFQLEILAGYTEGGADPQIVFTGDVDNYQRRPDGSTTDHEIKVNAYAGKRAKNNQKLKHIFGAGTNYLDIVTFIFDHFVAEWGGEVGNIYDPDGVLEGKELLKPETVSKDEWEYLEDICNEADFVFGNDRNRWYCGPKKRYYDPIDLITDIKQINSQTGKLGLVGEDLHQFNFNHYPDKNLQLGIAVEVHDSPQVNILTPTFDGRVNRITMNFSTREGQHVYRVEAQHREGEEVLLPTKRIDEPGRQQR